MVELLTEITTPEPVEVRGATARDARKTARALHVINGEHYAGAERVQDHLAQCLPEFGFDVGFVCIKPGRFAQMRQSRVPLETMPMRGRFDLRPARKIAKLVRREGYSLIHTHTPRTALIGSLAASMARVPLVHHVHSPTSRDTTRPIQDRVNALMERMSLRRAAAIIAVSRSMGNYALESGLATRAVAVVPNGVPARPTLLERDVPNSPWTIGTVALFRPRKGLEVLLDALAQLRDLGYPLQLRAVGGFETEDYKAQIMARVDDLGIGEMIDWRGFQRDVQAELATMDLFVLPSLFGEGLPMVILEAMSCGVPVVGTRVEGVPEVIRDGEDGLIAAPDDAGELARAMQRVIGGQVDWNALRESAYQRQRDHYSDRSMAAGVAAVYDSVLAPKDADDTINKPTTS